MGLWDTIKAAGDALRVQNEVESLTNREKVIKDPLGAAQNAIDVAKHADNPLVAGKIGDAATEITGSDAIKKAMESTLGKEALADIASIGEQFQGAMESITKGGATIEQGVEQLEDIGKQAVGGAVKAIAGVLGL